MPFITIQLWLILGEVNLCLIRTNNFNLHVFSLVTGYSYIEGRRVYKKMYRTVLIGQYELTLTNWLEMFASPRKCLLRANHQRRGNLFLDNRSVSTNPPQTSENSSIKPIVFMSLIMMGASKLQKKKKTTKEVRYNLIYYDLSIKILDKGIGTCSHCVPRALQKELFLSKRKATQT